MTLVSSKLFALNLVEVPPNYNHGVVQLDNDRDARIASLESQIESISQWKRTLSPTTREVPGSPSSVSSTDSIFDRLPAIDTRPSSIASSTIVKGLVSSNQVVIELEKDMTRRIMAIIQGYGQHESNENNDIWLGSVKFEPIVRAHVLKGDTIPLVLPAFPWKSVNKVEKVLGALPDLGEELALGRLNNLCQDIKDIYEPGAYVLITSDGLVYNDLLGIPDEETYAYGAGLRRMALDLGYETIRFTRIMNLLGLTDNKDVSKEEYLETVARTRDQMVAQYLKPEFDAREAILNDTDINLTYCGYMLFLAKDLKHSPITAGITGKNEYKRVVKRVAIDMITRGKAFAALIEDILPDNIRLSIHRSTGLTKLSFPLVPQPNHFSMTPWHCSIAAISTGEFRTVHAVSVRPHYDVVSRNGRPYYFRDRSQMWDWEGVDFEFFYPRGIKVIAKPVAEGESPIKLGPAEYKRLVTIGKGFSPVITSGFA